MNCNLKFLVFLLFICIAPNLVIGQVIKPANIKKEADSYLENGLYTKAIDLYNRYSNIKPGEPDVFLNLGKAYFYKNDLETSNQYLSSLTDLKKRDPEVYLYLGKIAHHRYQFEEAVVQYKKFLRYYKAKDDKRQSVINDIKRCASGERIRNYSQIAYVENLGEKLNTKYDEIAPVPSPNFSSKVYFSSNRAGSLGGLRNDAGLKDSKYGSYNLDMYSVVLSNGEWSTVEAANTTSNSPKKEVLLDFNGSGSVMFYLKYFGTNESEIYVDTFANQSEGPKLTQFQSKFNAENGDNYLTFFGDTVTLFSSQRPGGFGGYDIYYSVFRNGNWTAPTNLGPTINSAYDEVSPFLSTNGRSLFFSSNNQKSIGGLDVFRADFLEKEAVWNTPKNIGLPINSPADDVYFRLAKDGMSGYFSSARKEGFGKHDLYIAYFKSEIGAQSGQSNPPYFGLVEPQIDDIATNANGSNSSGNSNVEKKEYFLSPIFFDDKDLIINPVNKKAMENWIKLLLIYPNLVAEIQSHAIKTGPDLFDLYFSMKRAEKVKDYLISEGVRPSQIILRAFGSKYPSVKSVLNGKEVILARKLNRRVDVKILNQESNNVLVNLETAPVPKNLLSPEFDRYEKRLRGLSYKVQVTETRQLYNNKLIEKYNHIIVEQASPSNDYKYVVGLYSNFYSAEKVRQELFVKGIYEAYVVPYINGVRIARSEAMNYFEQYPDLKRYYEETK